MNLAVVIMAAGKGTRMHSQLPKVLHPLGGQPMVLYSLELAARLSPEPPVLIVGHQAERVKQVVGDRARFVEQAEQLGTGHAVLQTEPLLAGNADLILVFAADLPLLSAETLRRVVALHGQHPGPISMLTARVDTPRGFGRILRGEDGSVQAIIEEAEATPEQKAINELNAGVYCFDSWWLWPALRKLVPSPNKGEYYLTDTIAMAVADGYKVMAATTEDAEEILGINTREHLAEAERVLRRRKNRTLMQAGVTLIDPDHTYIHPHVEVGPDTTLYPGVCLFGATEVGEGCTLGPGAVLENVRLGPNSYVGAHVVLNDVTLPAGTRLSSATAPLPSQLG
ncbi:MAG: bifunctional N-acetylglucosamine-1-phosphate uridyltransferase/glucosamine-1-phosphate acetyltransferase [Caldilineae bacterium]|nr:MAG: bifunctional N-acetylglucosamine-1-phosphate uridyltransferase/glucosamine-1-phosphate acetyltransferase [Caldilineae bacterium]